MSVTFRDKMRFMRYRSALCWGIFVCHLLLSVALCLASVGVGMAWGDSVGPHPLPRPELLDDIDRLITLLGFPLVPIGQLLARYLSVAEAPHVFLGITTYVANAWLLAYWMSAAVLWTFQKARATMRANRERS
jgi:hypothetical protein